MSRAVFYNLRVGRPAPTVNRELGALARVYRPRVLACVEAIGYTLAPLPGYVQLRDRSRAGRANLALFVREDCHLRGHWWLDLHERWHRTEHHRHQLHPARSILVASVGSLQLLHHHQAPQGTDNTRKAQLEGVDALAQLMAPWHRRKLSDDQRQLLTQRPRLLLWDPNRDPEDQDNPGPWYLAHRIHGQAHGFNTDGAVTRKLELTCEYVQRVDGIHLGTDHPGALVCDLPAGQVSWGA